MDSTIRQRQRRGEASHRDLARAGLVTQERLELAAQVRACEWEDDRRRLVREAAELLGGTLPARLAADYAARLPQVERGAAAIAAARAWAVDPTEERRRDAADAAYVANVANAADATFAAVAAAYAANSDSAVAYRAAYTAAANASDASAYADEPRWQRERLALYLESQGWPNLVEVTRG